MFSQVEWLRIQSLPTRRSSVDKYWTTHACIPLQPLGEIDPLRAVIERVTEDHLVAVAQIEAWRLEGEGVHARRRAAVLAGEVLDVPEQRAAEPAPAVRLVHGEQVDVHVRPHRPGADARHAPPVSLYVKVIGPDVNALASRVGVNEIRDGLPIGRFVRQHVKRTHAHSPLQAIRVKQEVEEPHGEDAVVVHEGPPYYAGSVAATIRAVRISTSVGISTSVARRTSHESMCSAFPNHPRNTPAP